MLRKLIKLLFVLILLLGSNTCADFIVCDSGDINYEGQNISDICNGGYEILDITEIESFTGSYVNFDLGYWGTNGTIVSHENIEGSFPIGFFDINKETNIENSNPNYNFQIGYFGTVNSYTGNIVNIDNNYIVGFFDNNKTTVLKNKDLNFSFPVGYFPNTKIEEKSSGGGHIYIKKRLTYKVFFEKKMYENIDPIYLRKYSRYEIDKFANILVSFLLNGSNVENQTLDNEDEKRIELEIRNGNFKINLNKLISNLDNINYAFNNTSNSKEKIYILDYYLNLD